jgi:metallo-beta-lactamase class B
MKILTRCVWRRQASAFSGLLAFVLAVAGTLFARANPDWTEPFPPFRIAGNLYYVGSKGLANYLIATPQGLLLINSDLEANVPLIRASVEKLGFKFSDVKILLISHAHWDHDAGSAMIDPDGYKTFIAQKELDFRAELAKQKAALSQSARSRGGV